MGHRPQAVQQRVDVRQQHTAAGFLAHQRIGEVVDVLAGAGEMHELEPRLPGCVRAQFPLDQVLDGLDVVIGLALECLDRRGVVRAEAVGHLLCQREVRWAEAAQFGDAALARQRVQPGDLHPDAGTNQTLFDEDLPQVGTARGVTAVHGG
jgi:hypothetical protein